MIVIFVCTLIVLIIIVQLKTKIPIKHQLYEILNFSGVISSYSEIFTNIYLGDHYSRLNTQFLVRNNIKLIVNATTDISIKPFRNIKYVRVCDYKNLQHIFDMIDKSIIERNGVLVHCYAGLGRSATFLAYYVQHKLNISLEDSKKIIKNKRRFSFST